MKTSTDHLTQDTQEQIQHNTTLLLTFQGLQRHPSSSHVSASSLWVKQDTETLQQTSDSGVYIQLFFFYNLWHSRFWECSLPEGIREHLAQNINPFHCPYDPSLKSCIRQSVTRWHKPASGKKSAINSPSLLWQVPPNNKQIIKAFSFWVTVRIKAVTVHSVCSPELCVFLLTGGNSIRFYNQAKKKNFSEKKDWQDSSNGASFTGEKKQLWLSSIDILTQLV